jgi:hypothetical protein
VRHAARVRKLRLTTRRRHEQAAATLTINRINDV